MPYNNQTLPPGYRPPDNTSSLPVPPGFNQSGGGTGQYYQQPQDPYSDPRMHMTGPPQMGTGGFNPFQSSWFNPWQMPYSPWFGQQYPPQQPQIGLPPLPPQGYGEPQIGLPPLPPGMIYDGHPSTWPGAVQQQPPGQPPIGLPPLPPPGYIGDTVNTQVPGQFGGAFGQGQPKPQTIPRRPMGTMQSGFNQLPMQPVTQPIQQVSPLQQMGNPFGQGGVMSKSSATSKKRIPKGSMYGGMERL